jgi:cell wall-associated NlpC family hydrolase
MSTSLSTSLATSLAAFLAAFLLAGAASLSGCATRPPQPPASPATSDRGYAAQGSGSSAPAAPTDVASAMVDGARAMLGQPYRYGGAAPGGFDCSGLVSFAAQRAGLKLPRTAKEQLRTGVPVGRAQLEPGDLVFMRLAHKELHVGIAVGAGRFIHAPASGGRVRIDSLAAPPYAAGFLSARRVIGVGGRAPAL